MAALAHKMG